MIEFSGSKEYSAGTGEWGQSNLRTDFASSDRSAVTSASTLAGDSTEQVPICNNTPGRTV